MLHYYSTYNILENQLRQYCKLTTEFNICNLCFIIEEKNYYFYDYQKLQCIINCCRITHAMNQMNYKYYI